METVEVYNLNNELVCVIENCYLHRFNYPIIFAPGIAYSIYGFHSKMGSVVRIVTSNEMRN